MNILVFVLFFSAVAFAAGGVSQLGGASLLEPLKEAVLGIGFKLVPLLVFVFFGFFAFKRLLIRYADRRADERMKSRGYERYEPERVRYRGNYYRRRKGDGR